MRRFFHPGISFGLRLGSVRRGRRARRSAGLAVRALSIPLHIHAWSEEIAARHTHGQGILSPVERKLVAMGRATTVLERASLNFAIRVVIPTLYLKSVVMKCSSELRTVTPNFVANSEPRLMPPEIRMLERITDRNSTHLHHLVTHTLQTRSVAGRAAPYSAPPRVRQESGHRYRRQELVLRRSAAAQVIEGKGLPHSTVSVTSGSSSPAATATRLFATTEAALFSPQVIHRLADTVVQSIDRRALSYRERMGVI
jgi:hypothetical protein